MALVALREVDPAVGRAAELAAAWFGCDPGDVLGRGKYAATARARLVMYAAIRTVYGWGWSEIGRRTGRDHSTIRHGVRCAIALDAEACRRVAKQLADWRASQCAA